MKDLHIKVEQETYIMLVQKENYNQWIRKAIDEKLEKEIEPTFVTAKIKDLKAEIQDLEKLLKAKPMHEAEIHTLLEKHALHYKENAAERRESQRFKFIEKVILPDLKRLGYKGTSQEIDEILLNWPEK